MVGEAWNTNHMYAAETNATFCTAISSAAEEVERLCGVEQQGEAGCTLGSTAHCTAISSGRVVVEWS